MELFDISSDNADEFISYFGEDVAEDMKRVFFRGIGVKNDQDGMIGAFVYELSDLESDSDTKSVIRFAKSDSDEVSNAIQQCYKDEAVYDNDISETLYESDDEALTDALVAEGFSREKKENDFVTISLGELTAHPILKSRPLPDYISDLGVLSVMQYRSAVKSILFKGKVGLLEDLAYLPMTWFDREVSSCSISNGKVDGLFLVRATPSGVLMPVLFYAYGQDYVKNLVMMLIHSSEAAKKKYPADTVVKIGRKRKESRDMVSRLIPGIKGKEIFFGNRKE